MRFALILLTIICAYVLGDTAYKNIKEVTTERNAQICQIDPSLCQSK